MFWPKDHNSCLLKQLLVIASINFLIKVEFQILKKRHDYIYNSFSLHATLIHWKVTAIYYNGHDHVFQFVSFKSLSHCFGETVGFDITTFFTRRLVSDLIKPGHITKRFWKRLFSSAGFFMDWKLQTVFKLLWGPLGNMHNISNRTLISELWLLLKRVDKKHKEVIFMKDFIMSSIALNMPLHSTNFTHSSNNLTQISQSSIFCNLFYKHRRVTRQV